MQKSSSDTTDDVLQALAFALVVTVCACVVGAQQQEIEPRQHYYVQCTSTVVKHKLSDLTPGTRSTQQRTVFLSAFACVLLYVGCVLSYTSTKIDALRASYTPEYSLLAYAKRK